MKTEITQITLKLNGRDIELSTAEAREVQKELNKLFEIEKSELQKFKEEFEKLHPQKEYVPYPVYPAPIIIERERIPYWHEPWRITCGTDASSGTLCMSIGAT